MTRLQSLTITCTIILLTSIAMGVPGIPHQFYGEVYLEGEVAPDATLLTAEIDGETVKSTSTLDGKYGYNPIFLIPDPEGNRAGKTIHFHVNGNPADQTAIFGNGGKTLQDITTQTNSTTPTTTPISTPTTSTTNPATTSSTTTTTTSTSTTQTSTTSTTTSTSTSTTTLKKVGDNEGGSGIPGYVKLKKTCSDGIKNCHDGSCEEDIDCGGPCPPCSTAPTSSTTVTTTTVESITTPKPPITATIPGVTTTTTLVATTTTTPPVGLIGSVIAFTTRNGPPILGVVLLLAVVRYFRGSRRKKRKRSSLDP